MAVRIFTLAKELEMSSKDLIAFLRTQGHNVSSHMSNIDNTVAQILRDRIKPKLLKEKAAKERAAKEAAARAALAERSTARGKAGLPSGAGPAGGAAEAPPYRRKGPPGPGVPRGPEEAAARAGRTAEAGRGPWSDEEGRERRGKEKDKDEEKEVEKQKEIPARRRYFPTQEDLYDSGPRFGGIRRRAFGKPKKSKETKLEASVAVAERPAKVDITPPISVRDLSFKTGIKAQDIVKLFWQQGQQIHINQSLDEDMITTVAIEFGFEVDFKKKETDAEQALRAFEEYVSKPEDLVPRAPVVTFLGHVDHGKTSLLDKIRETNVTAKEAGGITQHLGAYRVDKGDNHVVFIDTPGHQAFTDMRARGANVTDVAVLVVAADEGVKPQTEEALSHARAAKVQVVVALNKIDKPTANVMRCKQELAALGLQPVEWSGDTEFVEVSALTSQGIDTLVETLSLTSQILELKANPKRPGVGVVLEAEASSSRGVLVTVLVRDGTLRVGDPVICGSAYGRVRGLWTNGVNPVSEAGPSTPVTMTGLSSVPDAAEKLYVCADLAQARSLAEERSRKETDKGRVPTVRPAQWGAAVPEVRFVVKTDGKGTLEALRSVIQGISTEEVKVDIVHAQVGAINSADITLADATSAIVLGFSVTADEKARSLAEEKKVDVRFYDTIYKVMDDVRAALQGQLAPQYQEEIHGHAEIRQIFKASKIGNIAGCMVTDGYMARNDKVRLLRGGKVIHTGTFNSLKRFKDDAKDVKEGFECGVKIQGFDDIAVGDTLEAFNVVEKPRQL